MTTYLKNVKPTETELKIAEEITAILNNYNLELEYLGTRPKDR